MALKMKGLEPDDVLVELLLRRPNKQDMSDYLHFTFSFQSMNAETNEHSLLARICRPICAVDWITKSAFTRPTNC